MEHYSPLPMSLLASVLGGALCVVLCLTFGGGVALAVLSYSMGGAVTLVLTATLLSMRATAAPRRQMQTA